ncbi:unnamed protein product, partial [Mycena citricolor]
RTSPRRPCEHGGQATLIAPVHLPQSVFRQYGFCLFNSNCQERPVYATWRCCQQQRPRPASRRRAWRCGGAYKFCSTRL